MNRATRAKLRRGKRDANDATLSDIPPTFGILVGDTAGCGRGIPDKFLLGNDGRVVWWEIKNPEQRPSARRLTDDEFRFFTLWAPRIRCAVTMTKEETVTMCHWLLDPCISVEAFNAKWLAPAMEDYRAAAKRRADKEARNR